MRLQNLLKSGKIMNFLKKNESVDKKHEVKG